MLLVAPLHALNGVCAQNGILGCRYACTEFTQHGQYRKNGLASAAILGHISGPKL